MEGFIFDRGSIEIGLTDEEILRASITRNKLENYMIIEQPLF